MSFSTDCSFGMFTFLLLSFLVIPQIFLSSDISNTLNFLLWSSSRVQVSELYRMIDWTSVLEFVKQDFRWLANILGLYLQSSSCQQVMVGGKWQYLAVIMFHLSLMPPWWWQNCGPYRTPIGNEIYFVHFARKSRERWEMCIREHRCLIAPWISTSFITKTLLTLTHGTVKKTSHVPANSMCKNAMNDACTPPSLHLLDIILRR